MNVSTRTPDGDPHRCAICGGVVMTESSEPLGDSVCPRCGSLLVRLYQHLGVDRQQITAQTTFQDLGADSLDTVELVMELEEEFDIHIPDEEAEQIQTVADAIRAILRRRNQFPGGWKPEDR